jgi:hypothetical protein
LDKRNRKIDRHKMSLSQALFVHGSLRGFPSGTFAVTGVGVIGSRLERM